MTSTEMHKQHYSQELAAYTLRQFTTARQATDKQDLLKSVQETRLNRRTSHLSGTTFSFDPASVRTGANRCSSRRKAALPAIIIAESRSSLNYCYHFLVGRVLPAVLVSCRLLTIFYFYSVGPGHYCPVISCRHLVHTLFNYSRIHSWPTCINIICGF